MKRGKEPLFLECRKIVFALNNRRKNRLRMKKEIEENISKMTFIFEKKVADGCLLHSFFANFFSKAFSTKIEPFNSYGKN